MKNLLTGLLCRLLVAAFCSSSLSSVVDAAPRELDGGGSGGGGADKGKDATQTRQQGQMNLQGMLVGWLGGLQRLLLIGGNV